MTKNMIKKEKRAIKILETAATKIENHDEVGLLQKENNLR